MRRIKTERRKTERKSWWSAGYTLAETLMVVLLVSLVSAAVAGGVLVVRNAYQRVTLKANAQTVLSTTITALEGELPYARDVDDTGENPSFISGVTGARMSYTNPSNGNITIHYAENSLTDQPLLTEKTVSDQLLTLIAYSYNKETKLFSVTVTVRAKSSGQVMARCPKDDSSPFYIRAEQGTSGS